MFYKRLTDEGIRNNPYYVGKENPFVVSGYGMPNCTCYCFGRASEILGKKATGLSLRNGKYWYQESKGFEKGQVPKLGAIMCFDGKYGHVSVVEEIKENGDVVCSNSNYGGTYFFLTTHTKASGYNNYDPTLKFQGFLYIYRGNDENGTSSREENNSKKYLNLNKTVDTWRVYPLNVAPVVGNESSVLYPSRFGGLSYTILGYTQENVAMIETRDYGKVQIYIGNNVSNKFSITDQPLYGLVK